MDAADFYSRLAPTYRDDFEVPHRKAYDRLAREAVEGSLSPASTVVDVGCGVGRWAEWLVAAGHTVTGVEPSPAMAAAARAAGLGPAFSVLDADADSAEIHDGSADVVVAMGSVQYSPDPAASITRMARWLRPGGHLWVLVDSLGGLVHELLRGGDPVEAQQRATTRRARFAHGDVAVEHHLFDAHGIGRALTDAGMVDVEVRGLLVAWNARPREEAQATLRDNWESSLALERELAVIPALADLGKQLLAHGVAPPIEPS